MIIPSGLRELTAFALHLIEICKVSQGTRGAVYRTYGQWIETGRPAGDPALANMLYSHIDRLSSHLFSPTDLIFSIDMETPTGEAVQAMNDMGAKILTRTWERRNIDTVFGEGVKSSLSYGACLLKQLVSGDDGKPVVKARLVMPWNFGVYNEAVNDLDDQEAVCETVYLTEPEVWRRVAHLPDAEKLYKRILGTAAKSEGAGTPTSFSHQVLSTAVLGTSLQSNTQPKPGGIVQLNNDPSYASMGPEVGAEIFPMHELYVKDDLKDDYVTIQLIEPDVLIAPRLKRANLFCPDHVPYTLIQPNRVANYFWGRSETADLMMLQDALTTNLDDFKRLMGVQYDKLIGFSGDTISDENYETFRSAGYVNLGPNGQATDLTPKMPEQGIPFIKLILELMDMVSGFSNILSGRGEQGVRAGVHADTLLKTASPRLRDRALLIERQCADAGDKTLSVLEAKDGRTYWSNPKDETSTFLLSQLPEDRRVAVDSHSTSPIYHDDHQTLVAFGLKNGLIDGEDAIEMLRFPNRDKLKLKFLAREKAKADYIQAHPEALQPPQGGKKKAAQG